MPSSSYKQCNKVTGIKHDAAGKIAAMQCYSLLSMHKNKQCNKLGTPSRSKLHPEPGAPGRANKQSVLNRRGGLPDRNGYALPPRGGYGGGFANGYNRRYDGPPLGGDSFYDRSFTFGRDRMRPYPPPYERRSPTMPPLREEYPRRPLPPLSSDPYSRPLPPLPLREELYERRPMPDRSDYLYSRRSPPLSSMRSPYGYDSIFNGNTRAPPPSATRRLSYF
ncbi:RRM domain-containing protein [Trichonephila clavipes]|nr:RRM domain-containing protein [Trichonephila clavipes]